MRIAIIGSGMASLTAACLLAKDGHQVHILEQNYLAGGCASSYFRKGFIFETGATTLVGLDENMPLRYLLDTIGVRIDAQELSPSMQIHFADGATLTRYKSLADWIPEAERVFGKQQQAAFWEYCYRISDFVWQSSLQQKTFPPSSWADVWQLLKKATWKQVSHARLAFVSMQKTLQKFDLHSNSRFVDFANEQLLITAQNYLPEVNTLFGATALCYTNYSNYYVYGGLYQLVKPLCEYIEQQGGRVFCKTTVQKIVPKFDKYEIQLATGECSEYDAVISGIPINNTLELFESQEVKQKFKPYLLDSTKVNSAFQVGIGFQRNGQESPILHHQLHLEKPLPLIGSRSLFVSFSPPEDWTRCPLGQGVASVSTHIPNPATLQDFDKKQLEDIVFQTLEQHNLLQSSQIIYHHSSTPSSWQRWTKRQFGFVGGYPQYLRTKPWQLLDARLDGKKAYICGDTTYPGQGIVGTCLSGILAYEKMKLDGR